MVPRDKPTSSWAPTLVARPAGGLLTWIPYALLQCHSGADERSVTASLVAKFVDFKGQKNRILVSRFYGDRIRVGRGTDLYIKQV